MGIDDKPVFKRARISNQKEQVDMVMSEAQYLDHETILRKLPNIAPSEVSAIMQRLEDEDQARMGNLMGAAAISAGVAQGVADDNAAAATNITGDDDGDE